MIGKPVKNQKYLYTIHYGIVSESYYHDLNWEEDSLLKRKDFLAKAQTIMQQHVAGRSGNYELYAVTADKIVTTRQRADHFYLILNPVPKTYIEPAKEPLAIE